MELKRESSDPKCTLSSCNCSLAGDPLFEENIHDLSSTLAEIMAICGINKVKAHASIRILKYSFVHYDVETCGTGAIPRKRICKRDLLPNLAHMCRMSRAEAKLTYDIMKCAFKALYHETDEYGYRKERVWVHAAKRTAQISSIYNRLISPSQQNYEKPINKLYKQLFYRIQMVERPGHDGEKHNDKDASEEDSSSDEGDDSNAKSSHLLTRKIKRNVYCLGSKQKVNPTGEQIPTDKATKPQRKLVTCQKCKRPSLICECRVDKTSGVLKVECGQGPFECQWKRVANMEQSSTESLAELRALLNLPAYSDEDSTNHDAEPECKPKESEKAEDANKLQEIGSIAEIEGGTVDLKKNIPSSCDNDYGYNPASQCEDTVLSKSEEAFNSILPIL